MRASPYLVGMALVAGVMCWIALLRVYQRLRSPSPEWLRKLVHVPGGLLALSMPFLFPDPLPVVFTCGLLALILAVVRSSRNPKQGLGAVLGSVARQSRGELWFPVSVAVVFVLSEGDLLLYAIPLLILTFADAAAALVGTRWGAMRYANGAASKTMEGSAAFFVVAFLAAGIPLALRSAEPDERALLIAPLLALVLSVTEALCGNGLDNLLIPVGGYSLLRWLLLLTTRQLALCLALALLLTIVALYRLMNSQRPAHAAGGLRGAS